MTIAVQQPIGLSQFTPFLCHVGSRVGYFSDPPGPSVVVEGGIFEGEEYTGLVLTPDSVTEGQIRIDLVIANPLVDGGAAIQLIKGTEGEAAPSINDYAGSAKIAEVRVTGNPGGVIIAQTDILDLRPILEVPRAEFKLLFIGRVRLGQGMQLTRGSDQLLGDDKNYQFEKVLTVKRAKSNVRFNALPGHRMDWLELEMPYYVEDFHLVGGPYDTLIGAQMEQDRANMGVGITWRGETSETTDSQGRDLPLIRVTSMGSSGRRQGEDPEYYAGSAGDRRKHSFFQFQAWGKI